MNDKLSPVEFFESVKDAASAQAVAYNLPASVLMAQMALESGWGSSELCRYYNYFGRKAKTDDVPYVEKMAWEADEQGFPYMITAKFKKYKTMFEGCDDWCLHITGQADDQGKWERNRYKEVFQVWSDTFDIDKFVKALAAVYSTDPEYADKILRLIDEYELTKYDGYMKNEEEI